MAPTAAVCESSRFGDVVDQAAKAIHVDPAGGMLLAGDFHGTLTMGTQSATAMNDAVFVAQINANGTATSLAPFAVPYGAFAPDPSSGGVILAGAYLGTADLGCPAALDAMTDLYVAKISPLGKCVWLKGFNAPAAHVSLAVTATGHVVLAGDADGQMDFDSTVPGPLPIKGASGKRDIFLVELDADGNKLTELGYGGSDDDVVNGVALDAMDGVIFTGTYKSPTLDFYLGQAALNNSTGKEQAFVVHVGGVGKNWFVGFAATDEQRPTVVAVDGAAALVAGDFAGTFGPLTTADRAFFLAALEIGTGKTVWSKSFDGAGPKTIRAIATGGGAVALTGSIDGDVDFGLGKLSSNGGAVVANLGTTDGKAIWNLGFGDVASAPLASGASFRGSDLFVAGGFATKIDFGNGTSVQSNGGSDVFVAKLCAP